MAFGTKYGKRKEEGKGNRGRGFTEPVDIRKSFTSTWHETDRVIWCTKVIFYWVFCINKVEFETCILLCKFI